ncbi:MAG: type II toxin-antitoxin system RelE/ParE family toxin [Candidatus Rokubacteria bacterium]|nr:type II toxin-antitoxin system RelE/ParE family toxin [Candidatus Rokubacteria bacterium]
MKLRIRRRAKKELLDIDDDAAFFAILKALLDLGEDPRPRGYDKVEGSEGIFRVWVGRDWRVLYSIRADRNELTVEAIQLG